MLFAQMENRRRGGRNAISRLMRAYNGGAGGGGNGGGDGGTGDLDAKINELKAAGYAVMKQDSLNHLLANERRETEKKSDNKIAELETKLSTASQELENLKKTGGDTVPKVELERLLKAKDDEISGLKTKVSEGDNYRKANAILTAAQKAGAVEGSIDLIKAALLTQVTIDSDGKLYAVDETGAKKAGKDGYMTVDELVGSYIDQNQFLKAPSGNAGAGGSGGDAGNGNTGGAKNYEQLASMSMEEYAASGGLGGKPEDSK